MADNSDAMAKYHYYSMPSPNKVLSHPSGVGTHMPGKLPEKREPFLFGDQVHNTEKCTVSDQTVFLESDTMSQKDP